jgi:small-conductance mechanosensitive channel
MKALHRALAIALAAILAGAAVAWWHTAPAPTVAAPAASASTAADEIADQSAYAAAQRLATLATEPQEPALAQSAVRLADHDLDLAFAAALRQLVAHPPLLNDAATLIAKRLQKTQELLAADQQQVSALTNALAKTAGGEAEKLQDQLDLAKSQVDLDQYELEEANQDLEEAGGNRRQRIEAAIQAHDAVEKSRAPASTTATAAPGLGHGLISGIGYWRALEQKRALLGTARAHATASAANLGADRQRLALELETRKTRVADLAHHSKLLKDLVTTTLLAPQLAHSHVDSQAVLTQTQQINADEQVLTLLDQRIRTQRDLANTYAQWGALVAARSRAQAHAMSAQVTLTLFLVLLLFGLDRAVESGLRSGTRDRRQVEMLHSISRALLQITAVLLLIVLLVGVPNQFGTMLGLVGAGLTVALKDFIIAFIGWFVLMGKNGVRPGDWVEINGVSGEVIEVGLFRTTLLETGNWGDAGNPTGRRVTFNNSFAIEGHYFNFSTSGQWLWDELKLVIPAGRDPHPIIDTIRNRVVAATAESARQAEQEWNRSVPTQPGRVFSGAPAVHVRPVLGGVELSVRYIARANDRFAVRAALNQAAVDLLGEYASPAAHSQGTASVPHGAGD